MNVTSNPLRMFVQNASRNVKPVKGGLYLHRHFMSPEFNGQPLVCKVTRIAQGVAYCRPYYGLHDDGSEWLGAASYVPVENFGQYYCVAPIA